MPCYHLLVLQAMTLRLTPKLKSDSSEQFAVVSRSTPSLATPIQTDSPVASRTRSKDLQKETDCSGGHSDHLLSDSKPTSTPTYSQVLQLPESSQLVL